MGMPFLQRLRDDLINALGGVTYSQYAGTDQARRRAQDELNRRDKASREEDARDDEERYELIYAELHKDGGTCGSPHCDNADCLGEAFERIWEERAEQELADERGCDVTVSLPKDVSVLLAGIKSGECVVLDRGDVPPWMTPTDAHVWADDPDGDPHPHYAGPRRCDVGSLPGQCLQLYRLAPAELTIQVDGEVQNRTVLVAVTPTDAAKKAWDELYADAKEGMNPSGRQGVRRTMDGYLPRTSPTDGEPS